MNNEECIVIVDDETQILKSLKREIGILDLEQTVRIETFNNTDDAIDFFEKESNKIFLLITDLRMPEPNMNGSELLSYIHKKYPHVILILLTAYSDISAIQSAISSEIQALIFKPWTTGTLEAEIKKALKFYKMRRENKELHERLNNQLKLAGDFQLQMLGQPAAPPKGILLDLQYTPLSDYYCGGDYYDFIKISDDDYVILVGDVSGHGIKPALITAMLKIITTSVMTDFEEFSLTDFVGELNCRLYDALKFNDAIIIAFTAALIKSKDKKIEIVEAGGEAVYLLRDNECLTLRNNNPAMGFKKCVSYTEQTFDLNSSDKLIFFTDGLIEVKDNGAIEGDTITKGLLEVEKNDVSAEKIFEHFKQIHSDDKYTDDVTIVVASIE
ncbi:MAG: fused response regulator/phosphatase [Spirochaetales bacterium]|nr:fused response regulator/phosphatase [Spirochaetales bacterium]